VSGRLLTAPRALPRNSSAVIALATPPDATIASSPLPESSRTASSVAISRYRAKERRGLGMPRVIRHCTSAFGAPNHKSGWLFAIYFLYHEWGGSHSSRG